MSARRCTDQVRLARAYLLRVAEPSAPNLSRLVDEHGPIVAAELVRTASAPGSVLAETSARHGVDLAEQDMAAAHRVGARLLIPEDDTWPAWPFLALDAAGDAGTRWAGAPLALWVRGTADLAACSERAVAVIGARSATPYGEHIAAEFGHDLARAGITVVSGAAYGIDGMAHRGALGAGGPTVAVLGCGIDRPYPAGHGALLDRIAAESGLVVTEYPPGTPPARHRFLVRNRLIAALGAGVVVVEAGRRSGTSNTAATACQLGRLVMAVPGPISSAMSVGCHELLRAGEASLVTSAADIAELVGRIGADLADPQPGERRETDGLDDRALRVHEALDRGIDVSADQIAVRSGVPLEQVRAVLPMLELAGLAARSDLGWRGCRVRNDS